MKNIADIDKNFAVKTSIDREGLRFYDIEEAPFRIYGVFRENGMFRRMPEAVAQTVSEGVYELHACGAGGRVRFVTDSAYVAIKTEYLPMKMPHFALTGSCGFDMYAQWEGKIRYQGTFEPPFDVQDGYESVVDLLDNDGHEKIITINFPLYSSVKTLYIGLDENATLKEAPDYKIETPVVYYGSSITQGGCASKPGSSYQSILSRRFDCNYINLGFSGSACGEDEITEYIKQLDMSVFVLDYDYNAPTVEHLEQTHSRMFEAIRAAHPDLPILIMPRPRYYVNGVHEQRRQVVYNTYLEAKAKGDRNVYYIAGQELMELVEDNGTVDGYHPTDSGFFSMARAMEKVFQEIWSR